MSCTTASRHLERAIEGCISATGSAATAAAPVLSGRRAGPVDRDLPTWLRRGCPRRRFDAAGTGGTR